MLTFEKGVQLCVTFHIFSCFFLFIFLVYFTQTHSVKLVYLLVSFFSYLSAPQNYIEKYVMVYIFLFNSFDERSCV